jgi:hypothetical protein
MGTELNHSSFKLNLPMKNLLSVLFVLLFFIFFSCKESGVQIAKPSTFVRYFNGGLPDSAQSIIETSDKGFLILANSTVSNARDRIVLIKTDAYGNQLWRTLYPDESSKANYIGFGLAEIPDKSGYLVVGQNINTDTVKSGLFIMKVEPTQGAISDSITYTHIKNKYSGHSAKVQGLACAFYPTQPSKFVVVGKDINDVYVNPATGVTTIYDTYLGEYNIADLTVNSTQFFSGSTKLAHQLISDNSNLVYWGGTFINGKTNQTSLTMNSTFSQNSSTGNSQQMPSSLPAVSNMTCNYFCQYGSDFGLVGSYSSTGGKYDNIVFFHTDGELTARDSATIKLPIPLDIESGNSICTSTSGGFVILGTVANDAALADTDYLMYSISLTGEKKWHKQYGGRSKDIGVKVISTSDGGFVVLGTTILANTGTVFMMKTDGNGNIQ